MPLAREEVMAIVESRHGQPFNVLGPHKDSSDVETAMVVRTFQPEAVQVWVVDPADGAVLAEAHRIHDQGLFEAHLDRARTTPYRLRIKPSGGKPYETEDPYRFSSQLSQYDLHLMREGTHYRIWERMGAHPMVLEETDGVHFVVWAPNAQRVSVVGDFNLWDGRRHPMRHHEHNGIWELFIPGVAPGQNYKYEIRPRWGDYVLLKADPYGFWCEMPPKTASRVYDIAGYKWQDEDWMAKRRATNQLERPFSIYEIHFGSFMHALSEHRSLSFVEAADHLVNYLRDMGFTHVEFMPLTEHPFYASWGYQTTSFFAPTSRFGTPHDLMYLIDALHRAGIGAILDWVPAHFPSDAHGLANFDGTHLYEHSDPREGLHKDWDTLVFNYGRTEVWNFLLSSALFWLKEYHFDGLRVDAVASMLYRDYSRKAGEWIPNRFGGRENLEAVEFLKQLNVLVHKEYPGAVTIAEESTAWMGVSRPTYLGGLGFTFKWNMGWMHDVLDYFSKDPIHRKWHANTLTFSMLYAYTENFVLALSHDEVVYGKGSLINKMPGDPWQKRANLRALLGYMFTHPGKKHLFMGMEFGQWNEWNYNTSLDWHLLDTPEHRELQQWSKDVNHLYTSEPALWEQDFVPEGFRWIDCTDVESAVYSFLRFAKDPSNFLVTVCSFTPVPRDDYRIGVPEPGFYKEVLNSDASCYGGSNIGNAGGKWAEPVAWHGYGWSLSLSIPPLSTSVFKLERP